MTTLTVERKAELFDYLASRLDEMKLQLSFGGSDWVYHEQGSPEELAEQLEACMGYEQDDNEDDTELGEETE